MNDEVRWEWCVMIYNAGAWEPTRFETLEEAYSFFPSGKYRLGRRKLPEPWDIPPPIENGDRDDH